jgi:predicted PhzF superfamily epimerase YddE/YHI9
MLFQTPSGPITVSELVPERNDEAWLAGSHRILDRGASKLPIAGIQATGNAPELVIDTGRTRLFRQLGNVDQLAAVVLEPALVMEYCRNEQIHGICLFTRSAEREIRMRVFTTSRDGAEDISTGGAVLGLLPYMGSIDGAIATGNWTIHQGFGPPHRRGTLFATTLPDQGMTAVGGRHRFVARGALL